MSHAGVATQGVAESFLSASHVTRTRRAHQVTAASLHILMSKAYSAYQAKSRENEQEMLSKEEWKDAMSKKSLQFHYWSSVFNLELICLRLVRALREGNYSLYIDALRQILPWMFVMDMCVLQSTHPSVYKYFIDGSFVVHKTTKLFSSIALDHCHEQVNAVVKGEGGAVGLTENPAALRRQKLFDRGKCDPS